VSRSFSIALASPGLLDSIYLTWIKLTQTAVSLLGLAIVPSTRLRQQLSEI